MLLAVGEHCRALCDLHPNHAHDLGESDQDVQHWSAQSKFINGCAPKASQKHRLNANGTMFTNITSRPQVVTDIRLTEFIQSVLESESQSATIIVCSTKESFVEQLSAACVDTQTTTIDETQRTSDGDATEAEPVIADTHGLLKQPSLLQLANSRKVKLVFCHDITHLRAYLATLTISKHRLTSIEPATRIGENQQPSSLLAILNPIDAHRFTSSFSAQGLNRTFSLAVEAAHATRKHLVMVEFPECQHREAEHAADEYELEADAVPAMASTNPWDEEVSILNVTTKSFGAGGRGWVGRTVTIRRIAERWCEFSPFRRRREDS